MNSFVRETLPVVQLSTVYVYTPNKRVARATVNMISQNGLYFCLHYIRTMKFHEIYSITSKLFGFLIIDNCITVIPGYSAKARDRPIFMLFVN